MFRHALLAEAVHAELLPGRRVRLRRAGRRPGGRPGGRGCTGESGGAAGLPLGGRRRPAPPLTASLAAAAAAEGVYAFAEARLRLERVLKLWERVPDAEARAAWTGGAAGALRRSGLRPATRPGLRSWSARPSRWSTGRGSRCGPGCCTSSWPAACAGSATPPRWARSSGGAAGAARAVAGAGVGARLARAVPAERGPLRGGQGRPRRPSPPPNESAPGPRRPTPTPRWAAPSSTSASRTRGWPSWRRRFASPPRPAT